jgi:glutamate synthase (NADPH/NADH) large chain/glutamate synthase (ferredoxin)
LRQKFDGRPDQLINFLTLVAEEVREILAELGYRRLDEIVGRTDLLEQSEAPNPRAGSIDLGQIIADPDPSGTRPRQRIQERNDRPGVPLDDTIIADAKSALDGESAVSLRYPIRNSNRTVGGKLSGEIAHRYGLTGIEPGYISVELDGSAGQSFGAWCVQGLRLTLNGEANDYVGKGMSGGEIAIRPPTNSSFNWRENVIVGNTVLYGATSGRLFVAGRAGERFAVRNSGALAVVEGCGDHGCEYMTAGTVVVLGPVGRNFAAGMSAGVAYVLDEADQFHGHCNHDHVTIERIITAEDSGFLRSIIAAFAEETGSPWARQILERFEHYLGLFWKVVPHPPVVATEGKDAHGNVAATHSHAHNLRLQHNLTVPTNGKTDDRPEGAPAH